MNYTSIEQSKKLLELGLSPRSADMFYSVTRSITTGEEVIGRIPMLKWNDMSSLRYIPCWSTGALLELMPKRVNEEDMNINVSSEYYQITYGSYTQKGSWSDWISSPQRETFLEVLYDMVVWLLENNYIEKENKR